MTALSAACASHPFSNGTEGSAWMGAWCDHCTQDHGMHAGGDGAGCALVLNSMLDFPTEENPWPEAWLPEPDDGSFSLPSRMVCLQFAPCEPCGGDPGAKERAQRVDEVSAYWRNSEAQS